MACQVAALGQELLEVGPHGPQQDEWYTSDGVKAYFLEEVPPTFSDLNVLNKKFYFTFKNII